MVEADNVQGDFDPDMQAALDSIVEELVDEVSLGLCFEIHRSCKVGSFFLNDETDSDYAITDRPGMDVLGQMPSKKNYECVCPNCQRNLAASRFAPHLEKCMGMGRNSSRIASRRIANNQKQGASDESGQEDENDNDWNYAPEKKLKRLKKDKTTHSPRNRKLSKLRNGRSNNSHGNNVPSSSVTGSHALPTSSGISTHPISQLSGLSETTEASDNVPNYDTMTLEERKALLLTSCGVISEHTKKMCTRTGKCSSHTDEQRRLVRQQLLRQSRAHDLEDTHIDIDTYDDVESQTLRESLQWEASSTSSPADSTSTNNSTGAPASSSSQTKRPSSSASKGSGGKSKSKKQKSNNKSNPSSSSSLGREVGQGNLYDFN